jgi:hypothetical protein
MSSSRLRPYPSMTRRELLRLSAAGALAAAIPPTAHRPARAQTSTLPDRRFLFVLAASGGASIVDGLLPQLSGPTAYTEAQLAQPNGSNFRCPKPLENMIQGVVPLGDNYEISTFLGKHAADTVVMTSEVSSVNHYVASRRAVTGNGINKGRSLQEEVSTRYGLDMLLPNCNMGGEQYGGPSSDATVPAKARGTVISDARFFALSTHGYRAVKGAPSGALVDRARGIREQVEAAGRRAAILRNHPQVHRYHENRAQLAPSIEAANLIGKLLTIGDEPGTRELSDFGLEASPDLEGLVSKLPNLTKDPFEAQAGLAYLLAKHGVSCAVTLALPGTPYFTPENEALNAPIGFDWSHVDHRGAQNSMWARVLNMADVLAQLLKSTEYDAGESMWERSLIYIATDFGRDKVSSGSSGHHLNNGSVLISPRLKGNRVYGGVDASTSLTFGFDPSTGEPDPGVKMAEADVYSAVCHALDVPFEGRRDFPCMVKA